MSENTNECVIEWIPGRDYVGITAKNGSSWKNRCEELEKEFPDDVREQVYKKCHGHCAYCGCLLDYKDMQVDHVNPIRCGGEDDISNMLPACRSCNHYKSALKPEEFRKYLSGIPKRLMRDSIPFQVGERFGIVRIVTDDVTFYYEKIKNKNRNRED